LGFLNGETLKHVGMSGNGLLLVPKHLISLVGANLEILNLSGNMFWDLGSMAQSTSIFYSGFPYLEKLHSLVSFVDTND
jgi:hypothetical protein